MPSALDSLLSREMQRAADALGNAISDGLNVPTFTWKGKEYPCIPLWNEQSYLNQGGQIPLDDLTLQVLWSEFTGGPLPQVKDMVIFQERQFRIEVITHTPGDYVRFICYDPARGS